MGFLVSPGVEVKEIDLTNVIPALSTSIGAFAGHFNWGPGNQAVTVGSEKDLATVYGKPTADSAQSFFTAASFLKYSNTLRVSRAIPALARNATSTGIALASPIANNEDFDSINFASPFLARYPGQFGNSIQVLVGYGEFPEYNASPFVENFNAPSGFSTFAENLGFLSGNGDEIHVIVLDSKGLFTGTPGSVLETFGNLSLAANARAEDGSSLYYKEVINNTAAYIYCGSLASLFNGADVELVFGSTNPFAASGISADNAYATVAGYLETTQFEQWDGLAPTAVGSTVTTYPDIKFVTHYTPEPSIGNNTVITLVKGGLANAVTVTTSVVDLAAGFVNVEITFGPSATLQDIQLPLFTALNEDALILDGELITIEVDGVQVIETPTEIADIRAGQALITQVPTVKTYTFSGGLANKSYNTLSLAAGVSGTSDDSEIVTALEYFADADLIDVNLVFAETFKQGSSTYVGSQAQTVDNKIIEIAAGRKDCVGFISAPLDLGTLRTDADKRTYVLNKFNAVTSSSYIMFDSTPVYTYDKYTDSYLWISSAGHMAGLCAYTDKVTDTWFSPAGFNRGQLLGTTKIAYNPKQADRDDLYKARINPIVTFPGQGTLLYGDKTGQAKASAFDRINVRRLFIALEKAVATAAKYQLFELNDEFTRAMFRNMVEPFLRDVKGRRGITDFLVVCDTTNNTGEVIDSNRFVADIYIKPARSINFITLNFIATRTGVEFNEIVGK